MNDESEASKEKPEADKPETILPKSEVKALKREAFSFTGKAKEYFGIWIINLLLTLVTLGIYGAWAKVRRQRYFYGNTWLDGHNFEYHAKPKQILIGRLIVFAFLIGYNIILEVAPLYALIPFGILVFATPWLINKAISFNARVSTYRNVQFGFEGSYGKAFMIFVLLPLVIPVVVGGGIYYHFMLSGIKSFIVYYNENVQVLGYVITAGILAQILFYPIISKLSAEYIGNRLKYGDAKFSTQAHFKSLYQHIGVTAFVFILPQVLISSLMLYYPDLIFGLSSIGNLVLLSYLLMIFGMLFYQIGVRNIAFNGTQLDGKHQMCSCISRRYYVLMQFENTIVVIFSIGLMRPWAAIRLRKYIVEQTAIDVDGTLDDIVADNEPSGSVVAAEYLDIDGIDFGF